MKYIYNLAVSWMVVLLCFLLQPLFAQEGQILSQKRALFEKVESPNLSTQQQLYLNAITENQLRFYEGGYVKLNAAELTNNQSTSINLPDEKAVNLQPNELKKTSSGRIIWKAEDENAHIAAIFVINGDMVTGTIQQGNHVYYIYPLGEGMHFIQSHSEVETEGCGMTVPGNGEHIHNHAHEHEIKIQDDEEPESYAGGECKIRLLVAYTNAVDAAAADILSTIELYIAQYNTANANSEVDHELELARAVEVFYTESNSGSTHPDHSNWTSTPTDLLRFQNPSDGFMDNIPGLRNLYDADMCMLMTTNLNGWGGYAYDYAPPASKSYCAMVWNNGIPQTFAHELGHLLGMHHDTFVDSSSGYYHGYIDVAGAITFRTIMSYSNGCGGTACPVISYWSNPDVTFWGNVTGTAANHDNARVSRETDHIIADYQNTVWNKSMFLNDVIRVREAASVFADNTISTNNRSITYNNGSQGQYVAANSITFKPGFRARSGSDFSAFLDECSDVNFTEVVTDRNDENSNDQFAETTASKGIGLLVSPNPSSGLTKINFEIPESSELDIFITSVEGRNVQTILKPTYFQAGNQEISFDVSELAPGMYFVNLISGKESFVQKLIVNK